MIETLPPRRAASLAAYTTTLPALQVALGLNLPLIPVWVMHDDMRFLWSGKDSWLVLDADAAVLAARAGANAAITDQSDGFAHFAIAGPQAREILAKIVPIDLHESAFAEDAVALTIAAHIGIRIWREDETFRLCCFRSFGSALHHALAEAAQTCARG